MIRRRYNSDANPARSVTVEERFWRRVAKTEDGCWEWLGGCDKDGYGQMSVRRNGKQKCYRAHHLAYSFSRTPIPAGAQLDHLCKNPRCVRPEHLEVVAPSENNARSSSPSALNAKKTHCVHGHEFSASNTRIDKHGHRRCRICDSEQRKKPERRAVHAAYMRAWNAAKRRAKP